jgi:hypothetical protein
MAHWVFTLLFAHWVFILLIAIAIISPSWFLWTIWRERSTQEWRWITKDSRSMYVDAIKAVASASAIAVSLVSTVTSTAARNSTASSVLSLSVKFAVVELILSIVGSICTILALSRGYDRSRSRFLKDSRRSGAITDEQGELNDVELGWILGSAWVGLTGFLLGFLFVGHIVFQR